MSTEEWEFTPAPADTIEMLGVTKPRGMRFQFSWQNGVFVEDDGSGTYSESALKREEVAADRKLDRDSRARLILRYKPTGDFERYGRRYIRLVDTDTLLRPAGVERGGALRAKPDEVRRRKIRLYKKVQAQREDSLSEEAFEALCRGDLKRAADDQALWPLLGGLHVFTGGRENTHRRPKGYAPWRPHKKTRSLILQVKDILDEYHDHLPMTARQIFYRLVAAYGYPKTEDAYGRLTEHLGRARRAEMIPFDHIRDDGISVMDHAHYADENAFYKHVHDEGKAYKRDKLARQKMNIRVYCEAAGMMPQLEKVCEPYSIPVYSCSGFDSLSAKYQLKEFCWQQYQYQGRRTVILHLGDHDPSGDSIFNDGLVADIYAFLDKDVPHKEPHEVATFDRVALLPEHIKQFNLPTEPPKKTDSRTRNWQGEAACQLEALPPDVLAGLLDASIKTYLNLPIYEQDLEAEEKERRRIAKALPPVGGSS